jgi:beta-glucosidase
MIKEFCMARSTARHPSNRHPGRKVGALAVTALAVGLLSAPAATAAPSGKQGPGAAPSAEARAAQLVAQMTLDEKISQMHTVSGGSSIARLVPGIPRLGIPDLRISNGPVGVGTGVGAGQPEATLMPAPVSLAATFDPTLAHRYGVVEGTETADVGHNLLEAPDINIDRIPENGRAFENYSEDPYLTGQLAAANIKGIQGQGVLAEVKHYAANNQETNRKSINEAIDDRTLHEIYLTGFQNAVQQGKPAAVMCAYPSVNGQFGCENKYLLTDVLRDQWGFNGFVQSDASATHTAVGAANAGQNLELRDNGPYDDELKQAVLSGAVSMQRLDELLTERLATEIRHGLFDRPLTTTPIDATADGAVSRTISEQGTVLLKNAGDNSAADNSGAPLPLSRNGLKSIALIGPQATAANPGGGGSGHVDPLYTVTPQQGIARRAGAKVSVSVDDGSDIARAVTAAQQADVAIVKVGDSEKEGTDRPNLSLPGNQDALIEAVAKANPHTVVVLNTGAPVLMPWIDDVPAVVEAWYPGEEDGNALAAVLFGDVNPSGKLPVTFPSTEDQVPASTPAQYPGVNGTATYSEGLQVGYRWYDAQNQKPLFPFGFGLSYTSFAFSKLAVTPTLSTKGDVHVSATVTNTGARTGTDTAQVYVTFPSRAGEPPRQLQGFAKVTLRPHESKRVQLSLDQRAFSVWDSASQSFGPVAGSYQVAVGDSSDHLPLHATVRADKVIGFQSLVSRTAPLAAAGKRTTVTSVVTNTGDYPVNDVALTATAPAGWTVVGGGEHRIGTVPAHGTARVAWTVTVPAAAGSGAHDITVSATLRTRAGTATRTSTATVTVPFDSVAAAFDNTGISDDANPTSAAFAPSGKSYSAQALAAAGLAPGATVTQGGHTFDWPATSGQPDNIAADGQVVPISGSGSSLGFLGAALNAAQTGTGTVYYTDGTTGSYQLALDNWWDTAPTVGDTAVATASYQNAPTGRYNHAATVWFDAVGIDPSRTVRAVGLPHSAGAMHIFALSLH